VKKKVRKKKKNQKKKGSILPLQQEEEPKRRERAKQRNSVKVDKNGGIVHTKGTQKEKDKVKNYQKTPLQRYLPKTMDNRTKRRGNPTYTSPKIKRTGQSPGLTIPYNPVKGQLGREERAVAPGKTHRNTLKPLGEKKKSISKRNRKKRGRTKKTGANRKARFS